VLLAAFTVALSLVHFQSPSGNINCIGGPAGYGQPAFVECLVRKHTWPPSITPRKPAGCDLDYDPYTVSLGHRRASVGSCRGDIGPLCVYTSDKCSTLAYDRSVNMGPIRCTSATAGVTCRYTTSPRVGFKIAREGYVTYRS
jgi:hypothetical protein